MEDATAVAEVLEQAAEVIEEKGWCQHALVSQDGRVCLYGALVSACSSYERMVDDYRKGFAPADETDALLCGAYTVVAEELERRRSEGRNKRIEPISWNDGEADSEFEVIDLFRRCAKSIRNGETV